MVRKEVKVIFPQFELRSIAVLMFLRFICPSLISPKAMGLIEQHPPPHAIRSLLNVAKILQNMSLNLKFDDTKDASLTQMNEFIQENEGNMKEFLIQITSLQKSESGQLKEFKVIKQEKQESIENIYNELKNSAKILRLEI